MSYGERESFLETNKRHGVEQYWDSRRPGSTYRSKENKRWTHRLERIINKKEVSEHLERLWRDDKRV